VNGRGGRGSGHAPGGNVAAGQDESTIVQHDVAEPSCARLGAGHYEDGRGGDLFALAGADGLPGGLGCGRRQLGSEPDFDAGVAFNWVIR
jgi:hypothetical protein